MRRLTPLVLAFGILLTLVAAGPAFASSYRYWSFWDGSAGQWAYASLGPSMARPADGSAWGFRFAVSKDAGDEAARPRAAADFGAVCGATPAAEGKKRVAVVVDFGLPADAPSGEKPPQDAPRSACAQIAPEATAAEALAAVAKPLRYNSAALLCAVSGYPKQGCGEPLAEGSGSGTASSPAPASGSADGPDSASPAGSGSGPSAGLLVGIAAVAALAAAALWQSRRRRTR